MGDHLQHVDAGDALLLEEVGGVGVGFQQQRGEHVASVHFIPLRAARLVNHPLQQAAHRARHLQLVRTLSGHGLQPVAKERLQPGAQFVRLATAGTDDGSPVVVVQQGVQQVLQGDELVAPHFRLPKRRGQGQFHVSTQHRSGLLQRAA